MQISKYPPQHRSRCYCQLQRECYYKDKVDNNHNQKKRYFVKMRNNHRPNSTEYQPNTQQFNFKLQPSGISSQSSTSFPNRLNTISCNHEINLIIRNILDNKTSSSNLHGINRGLNTIQTYNCH